MSASLSKHYVSASFRKLGTGNRCDVALQEKNALPCGASLPCAMRTAKKYLSCDGTKLHGKEWWHGKECRKRTAKTAQGAL
jgi:hypothetical protein